MWDVFIYIYTRYVRREIGGGEGEGGKGRAGGGGGGGGGGGSRVERERKGRMISNMSRVPSHFELVHTKQIYIHTPAQASSGRGRRVYPPPAPGRLQWSSTSDSRQSPPGQATSVPIRCGGSVCVCVCVCARACQGVCVHGEYSECTLVRFAPTTYWVIFPSN